MKYLLGLVVIMLLFLSGCIEKKSNSVSKSNINFSAVPSEHSGINFSNDLHYLDSLNIIEYLYFYNGGGVAVGDINNDGLEDIYFTGNQVPDRLYLNLGDLKFRDITEESGILMDNTWSTGVTMEDINNDGLLDIYVCKIGNYKGLKAHNLLYLNNGDSTFTEVSSSYGLDFSGFSTQTSFFDYDNDGDMDLYLINHSTHTHRSYGSTDKRNQLDSFSGDRLYENLLDEGKKKFKDVTRTSGIYSSALGYGLGLVTSDINQDGYVDIYVGNDFHEDDYLYINQGDKTFKEQSADYLSHTSRFTMGVDIADMTNNTRPDIFTLDMMPNDPEIFLKSGGEDSDQISQIKKGFGFGAQYARNNFQINRDGQSFSDIALMTNTHATDWSWSVLLADYDNDGLNDIFITNGIYKRPNDLDYIKYLSTVNFSQYSQTQENDLKMKLIQEMPTLKIPNVVFRNTGDFSYERLTDKAGLMPSYSTGAAYSDLDNDGDLDIILNNINGKAVILENLSPTSNNYIDITLQGSRESENPTGAKAYLFVNGKTYMKELTPTRGFQSASSRRLHFGLGCAAKVDSLKIVWLGGCDQVEKDLKINKNNIISRKSNRRTTIKSNKESIDSIQSFPYTHIENRYYDYEREPLMPEKLSTEGPAVVVADFNGDGKSDVFIGGAKYQESSLYIQQTNGQYVKADIGAFKKDAIFEDVDATAFDFDNDGNLDLYVLSGGNDSSEGDFHLEDRIYLNNGKGDFERFESTLPRFNGGSVCSADFNKDGFEDLFIGSRSLPGDYGLSPYSLILKNTGEKSFKIVQKSRLGMVTDSQWVDLNNDGLLDLVIVGDWMPITVMTNNGDDTFTNVTKDYGLENTQGMWNAIAITDFNGDGDKDILAANAGLNFKWKASENRPVKLYLDDFDDNGQVDPLIFYDFFGTYVPFASKDKLVDQLPYLNKKFLSYEAFSKVKGIEDLTGKLENKILATKKISELRSMIYLDHNGKFEGVPLPKEAQMSCMQDVCVYMNEGRPSVIFVGNYLGYVTELGDSDANAGGVLSSFDEKEGFLKYESLPLPHGLNTRKIVPLNDRQFLVISNNDEAYLIQR